MSTLPNELAPLPSPEWDAHPSVSPTDTPLRTPAVSVHTIDGLIPRDAGDSSSMKVRRGSMTQTTLETKQDPTLQQQVSTDGEPAQFELEEPGEEPPPEGGYGWVIVAVCFMGTFLFSGTGYSFGVIQSQLVADGVASASTIAFIGSICAASISFFAILTAGLTRKIGCRNTLMIGVVSLASGEIASGWVVQNVGGLFVTAGLVMGTGFSCIYVPCSTLPAQYFVRRRGLATGIVFSASGIGGAILAIIIAQLLERVGTAWTFRVLGFITLALGLPPCFFVRERVNVKPRKFVEWSLFRDLRFTTVFVASAIGTFPLFVPPFVLPLLGRSIGLGTTSAAGLVAGYNLASAIGRIAFGQLADVVGPVNSLVISLGINLITFLAIWPFSATLGPLVVFVIVTGISAGAFFSLMPTIVASLVEPAQMGSAMSMMSTGWGGGYLFGAPIAGYILQAAGGENRGIKPYRPAMFYAGGLVTISVMLILAMKLRTVKSLRMRM